MQAKPVRDRATTCSTFYVLAILRSCSQKAPAPPPDTKMSDVSPSRKDKKDEKELDKDRSGSESDVAKPAPDALSSPEIPHIDDAMPGEVRVDLALYIIPLSSLVLVIVVSQFSNCYIFHSNMNRPPPRHFRIVYLRICPPLQQLRAQLQDLMMGLLDLAGSARAAQAAPPAAQAPAEIVVDPLLIQQLVDMGFPAARSRKALILTRLNLQRAMEWLLEHENDPVRGFWNAFFFFKCSAKSFFIFRMINDLTCLCHSRM